MESKKYLSEFKILALIHNKSFVKSNTFIVITFAILFCLVGIFDNNLFLPNTGRGLFQHVTIWFFIFFNLFTPIFIRMNWQHYNNVDECSLPHHITDKVKIILTILGRFFQNIGFCCFIFNTLQNAQIINKLPFDYWDSINYIPSFIISRIYKLYLFSYFIPAILIYVARMIISVSNSLQIKDDEMNNYPIKKQEDLNILFNFGFNIILIIIIPVVIISFCVFFIHNRFDIVSIGTLIITILLTLYCLILYIILIRKYRSSIKKYKRMQNKQLDKELSKIHNYIIKYKKTEKDTNLLDIYLDKQNYLWHCKEEINKISPYPMAVKAFFTIFSSLFPPIIKYGISFFKDLF